MAPITDELIRYIARFGGMCRECADNHGVCPNSGLPCDDVDKAIRSVLTALNYGTSCGFVPSPLLDALSSERAARLAAEAQVSALQAQVAKGRGGLGWLYVGDDGIEWSANHPVRSGEMPDARLIRRATNRELLSALKDAWEAHGEAVRSEGLLRGRWADAADRARALQAQVDGLRGAGQAVISHNGYEVPTVLMDQLERAIVASQPPADEPTKGEG